MSTEETKDPILSELANGALKSLENAECLFQEAKLLSKHNAICRAYFLHQISIEECGKIELIGGYATAHLMDFSQSLKKLKSNISNHKAKNTANAYMLPRSEEEDEAIKEKNWKKALNAFDKQKIDFHQLSNFRKNVSLYVDFTDETFFSPQEQISEQMLRDIAENNYEFIELIRPKAEMLSHWAENPGDTKTTLKLFQNISEDLKKKHPDDPGKAMEEMLETLITQATIK